jgi:hypothetical protein
MNSIHISKRGFDNLVEVKSHRQLIQLMDDIIKITRTIPKQILKQEILDRGDIPILDSKSGLNITINCIDLKTRFNLNKLLECSKSICKEPLRKYLELKGLSDYYFFVELLQKTYDKSSDLFYDIESFQDGNITSFKTIEKLKKYYFENIKDIKVLNITKESFQKVFYFYDIPSTYKSSPDYNITDRDTIPQEIVDLMEVEDSNEARGKFNQIINYFNNDANKTKSLIQCSIKLLNGDQKSQITFKYNLEDGDIKSVDEFF